MSAKQLPSPPTVAAVVVTSGRFEATVRRGRLMLHEVGPRGGRNPMFDLDVTEAQQVLDLVAYGRDTLKAMPA